MLDLFLTLEGTWSLRSSPINPPTLTSHTNFYRELYANHFSCSTAPPGDLDLNLGCPCGPSATITITANNLMENSITFSYSSTSTSTSTSTNSKQKEMFITTRDFFVNKFNIFFPNGMSSSAMSSSSISSGSSSSGGVCSATVFGSVITLDAGAGSCSLLTIGPLPGQRVIEKYTLQAEGAELLVRYFISSIEGDYQVTRTYDRQTITRTREDGSSPVQSKDMAADMPALLLFPNPHPANNWKRVKSHSASTLQALQIDISIDNNLQSLVEPDAAGNSPDSSYPSANAVIMYRIEVQLPAKDNQPLRSWHLTYRYSHFRALWKHLVTEFADIQDSTAKQLPEMPPFPPKWPFVKSESSLLYRCKGLRHFLCGITSQGGYEPYVGSRAANMVDLLSAFLEVPNHFVDLSQLSQVSNIPGSLNSVHYCNSVYHTISGDAKSDASDQYPRGSSQENCSPVKGKTKATAAPVFVVVKGARNRRAPMFPHVSLFEWVPIVEYELVITRVADNASRSVFRRYKDISCWFQNILDILSVSHSAETLNKLNLPAQRSTHHINTFSASSKTDVTGNFVKYRIGELQKSIQTLLIEFPVVVNLPLSQDFFELHKFPVPGEKQIDSNVNAKAV